MTQKETIKSLLFKNGRMTMRELADQYPQYVYTARNRIAELRKELAPQGYFISFEDGRRFGEHAYRLIKCGPIKYDENGQGVML